MSKVKLDMAYGTIRKMESELANLRETNRLFAVAHEDSRQHVIKIESSLKAAEQRNAELADELHQANIRFIAAGEMLDAGPSFEDGSHKNQYLAEIELLQVDANRYRYLRDPDNRDGLEPEDMIVVGVAGGEDIVWLEQMDRAVDVMMELAQPTESGASE